ncbi:immunity 26/phosphotriesterase HocA family protein [Amycolatopsis nigrescens]|uniref:immunity 26/phosphotriesterase HocA family protein n=1 Tax=Amycolatopsis nigrescens TaxID=381445 RepID=UPI0003646D9B|nr:immunity 26/phosphotriesterase HocA family protein [Amycolatopsis nigrescens]
MELDTNFKYLKRSSKKPQPGDVFTMLLPDEQYLFGRVIFAELPQGRAPMPGAYLLYIYDARATTREPPLDQLTPDRLLIAPEYTNRMGWTKGAFETVAQAEIGPADLLRQHCFWSASRKKYFDETGSEIAGPVEPCGSWSLGSYRAIDDLVSDALGIKRAPVK